MYRKNKIHVEPCFSMALSAKEILICTLKATVSSSRVFSAYSVFPSGGNGHILVSHPLGKARISPAVPGKSISCGGHSMSTAARLILTQNKNGFTITKKRRWQADEEI